MNRFAYLLREKTEHHSGQIQTTSALLENRNPQGVTGRENGTVPAKLKVEARNKLSTGRGRRISRALPACAGAWTPRRPCERIFRCITSFSDRFYRIISGSIMTRLSYPHGTLYKVIRNSLDLFLYHVIRSHVVERTREFCPPHPM